MQYWKKEYLTFVKLATLVSIVILFANSVQSYYRTHDIVSVLKFDLYYGFGWIIGLFFCIPLFYMAFKTPD